MTEAIKELTIEALFIKSFKTTAQKLEKCKIKQRQAKLLLLILLLLKGKKEKKNQYRNKYRKKDMMEERERKVRGEQEKCYQSVPLVVLEKKNILAFTLILLLVFFRPCTAHPHLPALQSTKYMFIPKTCSGGVSVNCRLEGFFLILFALWVTTVLILHVKDAWRGNKGAELTDTAVHLRSS